MNGIPRPEHPKPQMQRENWMNLNGEWEFEFDFGCSGMARGLQDAEAFSRRILVPFCPESGLSGIGYKDFMPAVWYLRRVTLSEEHFKGRIRLHFGAVDYECHVWVNGRKAGSHKGGYSSFVFDITDLAGKGENRVTVCAIDNERSCRQCRGKQSPVYQSQGCEYTRTTGIWQTVWLEFVPQAYIEKFQIYPNIAEGCVTVKAVIKRSGISGCGECLDFGGDPRDAVSRDCRKEASKELLAEAFYEGKSCGSARAKVLADTVAVTISLSELHLWEPGQGRLYDLELSFGEDRVHSYFGMREVNICGEKVLLNGRSVFQRLVLDQGFYPDGIYTAPTEKALERDILLSQAAGFNGARLHQKVFEERFLYYCDRLGYLVWGEQGNWGLDYSSPESLKSFLPEWMEVLERDFNHPAIVGWCPFNETWDCDGRKQDDDLLRIVYLMTKQYDTTRPCIDTSGNFHVISDIYDLHDYEQDPDVFKSHYQEFAEGGKLREMMPARQTPIEGVPVFISEYGGIKWDVEGTKADGWGYGQGPKTEEEYLERYRRLTDALLDNPRMFGFCYTQLYDVEQELNGLYTYGRQPKFDMEVIRRINSRKAAVEEIEER